MKEDHKGNESQSLKQAQLFKAVESGSAEAVEKAIRSGANVNEVDQDGDTALIKAVREGHEDLVKILLENGANPNSTNNEKFTALHLLFESFLDIDKMVDITRNLLEYGADPEPINHSGYTPLDLLEDCDELKYDPIVEVFLSTLLEKGSHKDLVEHLVVRKFNDNLLNYDELMDLLDNGVVSVNAKEKNGSTLLHKAIFKDISYQNALLENGANIDATNNQGDTPLMTALYFGKLNAARNLIRNMAKVNVFNYQGKDAAAIAHEKGFEILHEELKLHSINETRETLAEKKEFKPSINTDDHEGNDDEIAFYNSLNDDKGSEKTKNSSNNSYEDLSKSPKSLGSRSSSSSTKRSLQTTQKVRSGKGKKAKRSSSL